MHRNVRIVIVSVALVLGVPLVAVAGHTFSDVPESHVFHEDIDWLEAAGVTKGCNPPSNTRYCPDDEVTRGQMAAFLRRLSEGRIVDAGAVGGLSATELTERLERLEGLQSLTYQAYAWVETNGIIYNPYYFHNPTGDITSVRTSQGRYEVTFEGDHPPLGNAQVSAYSGVGNVTHRSCQVEWWSSDTVWVICHDATGNLADSGFVVNVASHR